MTLTAMPMALRWQWLLAAQGMREQLLVADARLLRLLHGQPDPADLDRRRRRAGPRDLAPPSGAGRRDLTAIVLLERGLGGAATVLLGAIGFLLAIGRYDIGAYLWLEGVFVVGTIVLGVLFFSRSRAAAALA